MFPRWFSSLHQRRSRGLSSPRGCSQGSMSARFANVDPLDWRATRNSRFDVNIIFLMITNIKYTKINPHPERGIYCCKLSVDIRSHILPCACTRQQLLVLNISACIILSFVLPFSTFSWVYFELPKGHLIIFLTPRLILFVLLPSITKCCLFSNLLWKI